MLILILCLDDSNGMMFNNRRLSKDKKIRERILKITSMSKLFMNSYSYNQFKDENFTNIIVDEDFLKNASKSDYCFVENSKISEYLNKVEKIIIYKWNRKYPSDMKFELNLKDPLFKLIQNTDFEGNSHKKISEEVYTYEKK